MLTDSEVALKRLRDFKTALEHERREERKQFSEQLLRAPLEEQKRRGIAWHPVKILHEQWVFGDMLEIEIQHQSLKQHAHQFSSGKNIAFFSTTVTEHPAQTLRATVKRIDQDRMVLLCAVDTLPNWCYNSGLGIHLQIDEHSYDEMQEALNRALKARNNRLAEWVNILGGFGKPTYTPVSVSRIPECNVAQQQAVEHCMAAHDIALIYGPPGTGKTSTLVQAIYYTVQAETQVLVCAPTNTALDVLTERLLKKQLRVLRLGHPARISEDLLSCSLDGQLENSAFGASIKEYRKMAEEHFRQASKYTRAYGPQQSQQKAAHYAEAKALLKEARQLEQHAIYELFNQAQVICCTPVTSMHVGMGRRTFKTLFIDEASQVLEPMAWIPLWRCQRLILAGDPHQLPPLVRSPQAAVLSQSILDAALKLPNTSKLLTIQYRMHASIMAFSNSYFYNGQLQADVTVAEHTLAFYDAEWNIPVVFIDTSGCGFEEWQHPETLSYKNIQESLLLCTHLKACDTAAAQRPYMEKPCVGILTPYSQQRQQLETDLKSLSLYNLDAEIKTIDGFQGDECDIIYISLVRNNVSGELGFLNDLRRMNVALTRARKKLVVIGDGATLARHPFYKSWMDFAEKQGRLESAFSWI